MMKKFDELIKDVNKLILKGDRKFNYLPDHIKQVVKWCEFLIKHHPEADKEVILIAAYLHDIGNLVGVSDDHAVNSEKFAAEYLKQYNLSDEVYKNILHCIRSHRNRDIKPDTTEAKILCAADAASHFTDYVYIIFLNSYGCDVVAEKIARDERDISIFPELIKTLTPLINKWKELIKVWK